MSAPADSRRGLAAACAVVVLAGTAAAAPAADGPDAAQRFADFEEHAIALERDGGPYHPQLGETLVGLGRAQRDAGLLADAARTLARALHVARVNEGLHNPAHLPLLELLREVHAALGDADAVDRDYQQIYWIRRRNAGNDRTALLPVIAEIGRGRLLAYETAPAAAGLAHLVKADALFDLGRRIHSESGADGADFTLFYHAALVDHRLALEMRRSRVGFHDLRAALIDNGREVSEVSEEQARETLFQEFFLEGEWIGRRIVALTAAREDAAPLAHAEALCFLGDYYLTFRRNVDAMQEYRRAREVLARHGLDAQAGRLFGAPVPVMALDMPGARAVPAPAAERPFVDALLDVDDNGWPRNVRVLRTYPENDAGLAGRGARALLAWHYRPRFEGDRPVATRDVPARYVFRD
jgi:hypothetical protein